MLSVYNFDDFVLHACHTFLHHQTHPRGTARDPKVEQPGIRGRSNQTIGLVYFLHGRGPHDTRTALISVHFTVSLSGAYGEAGKLVDCQPSHDLEALQARLHTG